MENVHNARDCFMLNYVEDHQSVQGLLAKAPAIFGTSFAHHNMYEHTAWLLLEGLQDLQDTLWIEGASQVFKRGNDPALKQRLFRMHRLAPAFLEAIPQDVRASLCCHDLWKTCEILHTVLVAAMSPDLKAIAKTCCGTHGGCAALRHALFVLETGNSGLNRFTAWCSSSFMI